jgi:hypothetical protein
VNQTDRSTEQVETARKHLAFFLRHPEIKMHGVILAGPWEVIDDLLAPVLDSNIPAVSVQCKAGERYPRLCRQLVAAHQDTIGTATPPGNPVARMAWLMTHAEPFHLLVRDPELLSTETARHVSWWVKCRTDRLVLFVGPNAMGLWDKKPALLGSDVTGFTL